MFHVPDFIDALSCVVVNSWWGRFKILQVLIILPSHLVLINVLSVSLEIRPRTMLFLRGEVCCEVFRKLFLRRVYLIF